MVLIRDKTRLMLVDMTITLFWFATLFYNRTFTPLPEFLFLNFFSCFPFSSIPLSIRFLALQDKNPEIDKYTIPVHFRSSLTSRVYPLSPPKCIPYTTEFDAKNTYVGCIYIPCVDTFCLPIPIPHVTDTGKPSYAKGL